LFEVGQIVYSKAGRDKGLAFVVVSVCDNFLYLADGVLRKLEKPKKKKFMHVQKTNETPEELKNKLLSGRAQNSDIARYLKKRLENVKKEEESCQKAT
jgi:ribosomal protein L14E/L6E/L27E